MGRKKKQKKKGRSPAKSPQKAQPSDNEDLDAAYARQLENVDCEDPNLFEGEQGEDEEDGCRCPHVRFVKDKKVLDTIGFFKNEHLLCVECHPHVPKKKRGKSKKKKKGKAEQSYICLTCGHIGCPRDKERHAVQHHEANCNKKLKCPIAMDTSTLKSWCFVCDEWLDALDLDYDELEGQRVKRCEEAVKKHLEKTTPAEDVRNLPSAPSSGRSKRKNRNRNDEEDVEESTKETGPGTIGLYNQGNTCFFNSVMQNISETLPLKEFFAVSPKNEDGQLQSALRNFMEVMWTSKSRSYRPTTMLGAVRKQNPMFNGGRQHDAHELLRTVVNGVRDEKAEMRKNKKKETALKIIRSWSYSDIEEWLGEELHLDLTVYHENVEKNPQARVNGGRLAEWLLARKNNKKAKVQRRVFGFKKEDATLFRAELKAIKSLKSTFLVKQLPNEADENERKYDKHDSTAFPELEEDSLVDNVFGGLLQSSVTCLQCKTKSVTVERFYDLSLPIAPDDIRPIGRLDFKGALKRKGRKKVVDLGDGWSTTQKLTKKQRRNLKKQKNRNNKGKKLGFLESLNHIADLEKAQKLSLQEENERQARLVKEKVEEEEKHATKTEGEYNTLNVAETPPRQGDDGSTSQLDESSSKSPIEHPENSAGNPDGNLAENPNDNPNENPNEGPIEHQTEHETEYQTKNQHRNPTESPKPNYISKDDPVSQFSSSAEAPNPPLRRSVRLREKREKKEREEASLRAQGEGRSNGEDRADEGPPVEDLPEFEKVDGPPPLETKQAIVEDLPPLETQSPSVDSIVTANAKQTLEDKEAEQLADTLAKTLSISKSSNVKKPQEKVKPRILGTQRLTGSVKLRDCLYAFTDPEILAGPNAYGCENCTLLSNQAQESQKSEQHSSDSDERENGSDEDSTDSERKKMSLVRCDAEKRYLIKATPKILTVHLKRFVQTGRGNLSKCGKTVHFPHVLDISDFCVKHDSNSPQNHETDCSDELDGKSGMLDNATNIASAPDMSCSPNDLAGEYKSHGFSGQTSVIGSCKYQLFGIVVHSGSMFGGHYIAYVKKKRNEGDNGWYYFSDSSFRHVTVKAVDTAEAYVLFYERIK